MKLNEFFALFNPTQEVIVNLDTKCNHDYTGEIGNCPNHVLEYELLSANTYHDGVAVLAKKPECPGMTWRQLADAIESMPDWAQDMPVDVYIEDSRFIHNLSNHGVREIVTYFSKEPKDVQDDGQDYVSLILDTTMGWRISHR